MKKILILFIIFIFCPQALLAQPDLNNEPLNKFYEKAVVLELKQELIKEQGNEGEKVEEREKIKIKILSGKYKDFNYEIENLPQYNPFNLKLNPGDKIVVYIEEFADHFEVYIQSYYRLGSFFFLIVIFILGLLWLGRWQGVKTIISLFLSIFLLVKVFIPLIFQGYSPIILAFAIAFLITILTLSLIMGFKKKMFIALAGTLTGLLIAFLFSLLFTKMAHLAGLGSEEARLFIAKHQRINSQYLFLAGVLIGALGAVMDVAVSIASSLEELVKHNPRISRAKIFTAGINVGKDIIGTMSNTLIFAYVGTALPLLLLFSELGESYLKFFNFDFIGEEIVRAIGGTLGLIFVIPITAFWAAWWLKSKK